MTTQYLTNAFSVNMLQDTSEHVTPGTNVRFVPVSEARAREIMRVDMPASAVGHQSTAEVLTARLAYPVPANRVNLRLGHGDTVLLAQVATPRLAEGQVLTAAEIANLPIAYWLVEIG
jgi:hypothetical protein